MKYLLQTILFAVLLGVGVSAQSTLITNATLLDPDQETAEIGHVLIDSATVVSVLSDPPADFGGTIIDGTGKYLIPGLHDMHTHSWGNRGLSQTAMHFMGPLRAGQIMLLNGVTGFLDLFSMEDMIFKLRENQRTKGVVMADLYAAGPILTCTDGHGTEYGVPTRTVDTPEEAAEVVADLATSEPDVIKLVFNPENGRYPSMDQATMEAVVTAAKDAGIKTIAHVEKWAAVETVVAAGVDAITHVPEEPVTEPVAQLLAENRVAIIPTLTVHMDMSRFLNDTLLVNDPLLQRSTTPAVLNTFKQELTFEPMLVWKKRQEEGSAMVLENVRILREAGVTVLTGTDSGNPGVFQGYSIHRELGLMAEAGLSNWQALQASTTAAQRFLDQPVGFSPGSVANFVLLDSSPVEDIGNTKQIHAIVYRGKHVDRKTLAPN